MIDLDSSLFWVFRLFPACPISKENKARRQSLLPFLSFSWILQLFSEKSYLICAFGAILMPFDQPSSWLKVKSVWAGRISWDAILYWRTWKEWRKSKRNYTQTVGANVLETKQREQPICRSNIFNSATDGPLVTGKRPGLLKPAGCRWMSSDAPQAKEMNYHQPPTTGHNDVCVYKRHELFLLPNLCDFIFPSLRDSKLWITMGYIPNSIWAQPLWTKTSESGVYLDQMGFSLNPGKKIIQYLLTSQQLYPRH